MSNCDWSPKHCKTVTITYICDVMCIIWKQEQIYRLGTRLCVILLKFIPLYNMKITWQTSDRLLWHEWTNSPWEQDTQFWGQFGKGGPVDRGSPWHLWVEMQHARYQRKCNTYQHCQLHQICYNSLLFLPQMTTTFLQRFVLKICQRYIINTLSKRKYNYTPAGNPNPTHTIVNGYQKVVYI